MTNTARSSGPAPGALSPQWQFFLAGASATDLFEIVADVERYPEFVPGCLATRVIVRQEDRWLVENRYAVGPVPVSFRSHAYPEPPWSLRIVSEDGPWKRLDLHWTFDAEDDGCRGRLGTLAIFRSPVVAALARSSMREAEGRLVRAFEMRARKLLGLATGISTGGGRNEI